MIWNCIDLAYYEQLGEGQYVEGYQQALKDVWRSYLRSYFQIDKLSDTEKTKLAKKLQKILNKIEKENKNENYRNNY